MTNLKEINSISKTYFPLPLWRYILIFQSWQQLLSWMVIVSATAFSVYFLLNILDPRSVPIEAILLGVAFGSMFSVIMVIPVEIHFKGKTNRLTYILVEKLYSVGYIQDSQAGEITTFKQKFSSRLKWTEGNVVIKKLDHEIVVTGGWFILGNLRRAIKISYFKD
ncbi:hypothetical protein [Massilia sp.]|uniref:hypothetical protein n=1 Tax=Massilia sp. TaxID=1882437 RepID=UPI00391C9B24